MQVSAEQLKQQFTISFSATAPNTIKAGDTFVTNAVLDGTITDNKTPVTLVATATVTVTPKPEEPDEPDDPTPPPYIPPTKPSEPADPDDTGVSDLLNTEDHIQYLFGYPDGTFGPENNMTRAEVAQMFYNLLLNQNVTVTVSFADVSADAWYAQAVNALASLGIVQGVGDGMFAPERTITRAEFTVIAMRFAELPTGGTNPFSDVRTSDWFYAQVVGAAQYGWITGYTNGTFGPNNTITRAEVTAIVNRMLSRSADEDFVDDNAAELVRFNDVSDTYWAYYDIMEATNSHEYEWDNNAEEWTDLA